MDISMFELVTSYSKRINDGRTRDDVLTHTVEELGELTEEVLIATGRMEGESGPDGIIGETVDIIACIYDMVYIDNNDITDMDVMFALGHYIGEMLSEDVYSYDDILLRMNIIIGQLSTDVKISKGRSYKTSEPDAILNRCMKLLTMCYKIIGAFSEINGVILGTDDISDMLNNKCIKWEEKVSERLMNKVDDE